MAATIPLTAPIRVSTTACVSVSWSEAGIVTCSKDRVVKLWQLAQEPLADSSSAEVLRMIHSYQHSNGVTGVASSADAIAHAGHDGQVYLRNAADLSKHAALSVSSAPESSSDVCVALSSSPNRRFLAGSGAGLVTLATFAMHEGIPALDKAVMIQCKTTADVKCVSFSPDSARAAAGHADGSVSIIDVRTGSVTCSVDAHQLCVRGVAWSSDGTILFTASDDSRINCFDLSTAGAAGAPLICSMPGHTGAVLALATPPAGLGAPSSSASNSTSLVASAGSERTVKLWDARKRECVHTWEGGHAGAVRGLSWSRDGERLASVSDSGAMQLHSIAGVVR